MELQLDSKAMFARQVLSAYNYVNSSFRLVEKVGRSPLTSATRKTTTTMSSEVHLSPWQKPVFYVPGITSETADTANELLQENHDRYHIYFNSAGFHVRSVLTSFIPMLAHGC